MVLRAKWQRQAVMLFNHLEGGPAMTLTGPRRRKGNESHSVRCTESSDGVHRQRTCGLEGRLALVSSPSLCVQTSITIFIARNSSALQQERRSTWKYERRFALLSFVCKRVITRVIDSARLVVPFHHNSNQENHERSRSLRLQTQIPAF